MWNDLIRVRDNNRAPKDVRQLAEMLLRQLNTAGNDKIKKDVSRFLQINSRWCKKK